MGLIDLPAPLLSWLDAAAGHALSPAWRLWLWGLIGGAASMGLYWLLSPQAHIADTRQRLATVQRELNAFDGEFEQAWPMMRRMLGLAFKQLGIVLLPAVAAMLPVLCLLAWMSTHYSHDWPGAGSRLQGQTTPEGLDAEWLGGERRVYVSDSQGAAILDREMSAPVPMLHKRQWWNSLIGNPAGYLPEHSPLEAVEFPLPAKHYLGVGPEWMRGWEFSFLVAVFISALGLKLGFRIQ